MESSDNEISSDSSVLLYEKAKKKKRKKKKKISSDVESKSDVCLPNDKGNDITPSLSSSSGSREYLGNPHDIAAAIANTIAVQRKLFKEEEGTAANNVELIDGSCVEKWETTASSDVREPSEVSGKSNNFKSSEGISALKARNRDETVRLESSVSPENSASKLVNSQESCCSKVDSCHRQRESLDESSCVKNAELLAEKKKKKKKKKLDGITTCKNELPSGM